MISYADFKKTELKVAKIIDVQNHPNADKLYVIQIEVGDKTKQIVAGIRASYAPEALIGKKVIVVDNLEPAVIRGVESNGMLLAAKNEEGNPIVFVSERDVPSGTTVQ